MTELLLEEYRIKGVPYRMQDQYDRSRSDLSFQALVLQNEFLRATFLPGLGRPGTGPPRGSQ